MDKYMGLKYDETYHNIPMNKDFSVDYYINDSIREDIFFRSATNAVVYHTCDI